MLKNLTKIKTLVAIASLCSLFAAGQAEAKNCGGLNEKSCWSPNPAKWCEDGLKYKPTGAPGKGTCVKKKKKKKKKCGGLGESSCWNASPAKWCEGDLKYKPSGVPGKGTCVSRAKKKCGNLNQSSCWNVNPKRWCNDDLKYKPKGIPGKGTCVLRVEDDDLKDVASDVVDKLKEFGSNNPLASLRSCLKQPQKQAQLISALNEKSKNDVNRILGECNASPDALASFASDVLGDFSESGANGGARSASSTRSGSASSRGDVVNLSLSGLASAGAGVGIGGGVGYRIELRSDPQARFFVAGDVSVGFGLSAGVDVAVGLNYGEMPTNHWAREGGASVSYSGKAVYGGGVAIDFGTDSVVPSGFTLSGGAGAGVEAGVVSGSVTQYLYNF